MNVYDYYIGPMKFPMHVRFINLLTTYGGNNTPDIAYTGCTLLVRYWNVLGPC